MAKRIFWDVTDRCNLRCLHCSSTIHYKYSSPSKKKLNTEEAKIVIDKLSVAKIYSLHFLGGEPLVRKDIIELLNYASERIPRVVLVTNGTLIDEKKAEEIVKSGVSRIGISFDGPTKESFEFIRGKGNFEKVKNAIQFLVKSKERFNSSIKISLDATLTKVSINLIPEFIRFAEKFSVDSISFSKLSYAGEALKNIELLKYSQKELINCIEKNLDLMEKYLKPDVKPSLILDFIRPPKRDHIKEKYGIELSSSPYKCGGGINVGFLRADGILFPCRALSGDEPEYHDFFKDIKNRKSDLLIYDFYEIWNSESFVKLFKLLYEKEPYENYYPCNGCRYLKEHICRPCPLNIYLKNFKKTVMEDCLLIRS